MRQWTQCPTCKGLGKVNGKPCPTCGGKLGVEVTEDETLRESRPADTRGMVGPPGVET